jgi:hypothetical protein
MERSFVNSLPNPQNIYVGRKLENDVLKSLSTAVSIGAAAGGNPISVFGVVNKVIHNFGPQTGPIQDTTGRVGDVITIANVFRTGRDYVMGNFSDAGLGAVGIANAAFGKSIDAQKRKLMEPITVSDSKQISFRRDDGFTKVEGSGSISVTKTYTPPKTVRPFGPPDIFEGSTKTVTNSQWTSTVKTGNPNFSITSGFPSGNYQRPNLGSYNFRPPSYSPPSFSPGFRTSVPSFNSFGRIR